MSNANIECTPGPWEARYSSVIDVEKDEIIAVMTCGSVHRKNELEDYDTARFIAAAPDMYEALNEAVRNLVQTRNRARHAAVTDPRWSGVAEILDYRIVKCRAALSRARGEQ